MRSEVSSFLYRRSGLCRHRLHAGEGGGPSACCSPHGAPPALLSLDGPVKCGGCTSGTWRQSPAAVPSEPSRTDSSQEAPAGGGQCDGKCMPVNRQAAGTPRKLGAIYRTRASRTERI